MNRHRKFTHAAAGIFFLALALLLWPSARKSDPDTGSAVGAAPLNRQHSLAPAPGSRPKRDLSAGRHRLANRDLSTMMEQLFSDSPPLTRDQIDNYLSARPRSASALLTAYRLSWDEAFLREAIEKFPDNPQVQLTFLARLVPDPAERLEILESLKHTDPKNGMVDGLLARALFDLGRNDEALAALSQSVGKPIRDYCLHDVQNAEEAYLAAGFPPLEAKAASIFGASVALVVNLRSLADMLKKQRESAGLAGDDVTVQSSRDTQLQLASQLQLDDAYMMKKLIGISLENSVLEEIDTPEARARIEEMALQRNSMIGSSERVQALMKNSAVPETDWLHYFDRLKVLGEGAANDWILEKHPDL